MERNGTLWHTTTMDVTFKAQLHRLIDRPRETLLVATSNNWLHHTLMPFNDLPHIKDWITWAAFVAAQKQKLDNCVTWIRYAASQSSLQPHKKYAMAVFYELVQRKNTSRPFWMLRMAPVWAYHRDANVLWVDRTDGLQLLAVTQVKHVFDHRDAEATGPHSPASIQLNQFARFASRTLTTDDMAMQRKMGIQVPHASALWTQLVAEQTDAHYANLFARGQELVGSQPRRWFDPYIVYCLMQRSYDEAQDGVMPETADDICKVSV